MDTEKIKTLETDLATAKNPKEKTDALNALAFEIRNTATNRSIELSKEAQNISSQINYPEGKAAALNNEGFCYVQITNYELALEKCFEAFALFEETKNEKGIALAHYNLCLIYQRIGVHNLALEHISKAFSYHQKMNDKFEMARCCMQLGFLYGWLGDNETSIEVYNKGLDYSREINNRAIEAAIIMGTGQTYMQMKNYEMGRENLLKSMEIREQIKDWRGYAASMNSLMTLCYETGEFEEAEKLSLKGLKLAKELGDKMGISRFVVDLGKIYLKQGKLKEAEEAILQALDTARKINLKMVVPTAHFFLSEIYKQKGDYKKALEFYQVFHESKEEMFSTENAVKAKSMQLTEKIENAQREAEINRLKNVELKNAYDEIAEKNKDITDSINYAKRIQHALLSSDTLLKEFLQEYFVLFKPKDIVSGDFYWSVKKDNAFYLAVCDSTGHGVPGAFMSLLNMSFLNEAINEKNISECNEIFNYVRNRLIESFIDDGAKDGMEGVLLKITGQKENLKIEFAAAHNGPVLIKNGNLLELPYDKMSVGEGDKKNSFAQHTIDLQKGDTLYLYTDGYADQFGGDRQKKFKYKQLYETLAANSHLPMALQKQNLEEAFENWKGNNPQTDDVLIVGIKA